VISKLILNPYILTGLVATLILGYFYALYEGHKNGINEAKLACLEQQKTAVARAIEQTNIVNQENAQIAAAHYEQQLQQKPKIRTIEKRIIEYVENTQPGHCDIDDRELQILTDLTNLANTSPKTSH